MNVTTATTNVTTFNMSYCSLLHGRWETNAYILPPIIILGFTLNTLVIVVFRRLNYNHRSAFLLTALAITDNAFLIIQFILEPVRYYVLYARVGMEVHRYWPWGAEPRIYLGTVIFYKAFLLVRNWLTVLIQVERLITIIIPLKAGLIMTKLRLTVLIVISVIFSICFAMYYPTTLHVIPMTRLPCAEEEVTHLSPDHRKVFAMFNRLIDPFVRSIIPTFLVFVANILLLVVLYVKLKERQDITAQQGPKLSESKATKMVISMSFVFLVLEMPGVVAKVNKFVTGITLEDANTAYTITSVLNSCVNFFLYYFINENFRSTSNALFKCSSSK